MPLNVRKFCTSALLAFVSFLPVARAQTVPTAAPQPITTPLIAAPASGDVMRDRISKAKAYIAVRNYNAAISELENIRKETSDVSVKGVAGVLLMNSYLEQGDYKRAQDLLGEFYAAQKTSKAYAAESYMAVAGQIIKGARSRVERYRSLGLSVADRTLPLEASNDLDKMRETLELVITQSKEIGTNKTKSADAMMLLEEASSSRSMLARDDYDSRRWRDEVADTREKFTKSHTVLTAVTDAPIETAPAVLIGGNASTGTMPTAAPGTAANAPVSPPPAITRDREVVMPGAQPPEAAAVRTENPSPVALPPVVTEHPKAAVVIPEPAPVVPEPAPAKDTGPLDVGSLVGYATSQAKPVYPVAAKTIRATGIVKVEVTVNEAGSVTGVQKSSGHSMLQAAARDAIMKWKFKPFTRDGQPVKATGFVNFNFAL